MSSTFWLYGAAGLFAGVGALQRAIGSAVSLDIGDVLRLGCITKETALATMMISSRGLRDITRVGPQNFFHRTIIIPPDHKNVSLRFWQAPCMPTRC